MRATRYLFLPAVLFFLSASLFGCRESGSFSSADASSPAVSLPSTDPDVFMEVDCLLPGQVRKLGSMIYAGPRRPLKTTAGDCEIRGGEYVVYDRANYKSALAVWIVEAETGDPQAQTYVGEIYMKSPPGKPRYDLAAKWFERAAANGYKRAQINLGYLYEHGLGVPKNMDRAVSWYSRASGVNVGDIVQREQLSSEERAELAELKEKNRAQLRELQRVRKEMAEAEKKILAGRQDLEQRSTEIKKYQQEVVRRQKELERIKKQLKTSMAARDSAEEGELQARFIQLERSLQKKEKELARQEEVARALSSEIKEHRNRSKSFETSLAALNRKLADLPGPRIEILNPELLRTRGIVIAPVSRKEEKRTITGKVWSPAGLRELKINGNLTPVEEDGLFRAIFPMRKGKVKVDVVAVDENGRSDRARFSLQYRSAATPSLAGGGRGDDLSHIAFGRYFALVIGNNKYRGLPPLKTAVADATEVGRLLREQYGFTVTVLLNADRHAILSTLNDFRRKLTEKDNFLIYYAGHGTLEERNTQGFWLPVDADLDDDVNWLPTDRVTGIMNLMSAKQIMIIADACYSGIMTRASLTRLDAGRSKESYRKWLKKLAGYKSRVVISSGETKPVLDGGGGKHSVFARALLETLRDNDKILLGIDLHRAIAEKVVEVSSRMGHDQVPQYAGLNRAGHELGDFLFIPKDSKG